MRMVRSQEVIVRRAKVVFHGNPNGDPRADANRRSLARVLGPETRLRPGCLRLRYAPKTAEANITSESPSHSRWSSLRATSNTSSTPLSATLCCKGVRTISWLTPGQDPATRWRIIAGRYPGTLCSILVDCAGSRLWGKSRCRSLSCQSNYSRILMFSAPSPSHFYLVSFFLQLSHFSTSPS
jgi:hypothetical protein